MSHPLRFVQLIYLLLFALVVGVFWGTWFSLSRSIASTTPSTFLEVGRTMIGNLGGPMSILMPATLALGVLLLIALLRRRRLAAFSLTLIGWLCLIAALVITLTVNVPIDNDIVRWTVDTLPSDWTSIRDRWQHYHTLRTFLSIAGLASAIASVVWD